MAKTKRENRSEYMRQWRASQDPKQLAAAQKKWRKENKDQVYAGNKRRHQIHRAKGRKLMEEIKTKYGCMNPCCQWKGPLPSYALDFHHVDGKEKKCNVGAVAGYKKRLAEEINKCVVLCAICHRLETYGDLNASDLPRCEC